MKTLLDRRLVGNKDWRSKTGFVGVEDSLGSKTWDPRLVVIEDLGSKTQEQRLVGVGIEDWVVGIEDSGSKTLLDRRHVGIE